MAAPYEGKRGWRTVVVFDENSMELDPSLPPPWWPNWSYKPGDLVVNKHHFYRCRVNVADSGRDFDAEPNRSAWVDITSGDPDVREQLPDAVGAADKTVTASIAPNRRLFVDTRLGAVNVQLVPVGQWATGDVIEIVDDYRSFDKNPCTLLANGVRINAAEPVPSGKPADLILSVVGQQDVWRFVYYINANNPSDQWLYTDSAPTESVPSGGAQGRKPPVLVIGPIDQTVSPGITYIADTTNGPIDFSLDEPAFEDGDQFTVMDYKWQFGEDGKQAVVKGTPTVKLQDADTDGNFYMNVKGPTSGWPFLYYGGVLMCLNAPLDQNWIDSVVEAINTLNGHPSSSKDAVQEQPPLLATFIEQAPQPIPSFPTFTTVKISTDIPTATIWKQYDVDMGRKKSLTITLPKVPDVPARSRIRVRLISKGRGVINVLPDSDDQILGMFGNLNATPKGTPRTVHGQYAMLELESDGANEWMVV